MELDSKNYDAMKKIKDALDALQGIKYVEGVGFVPIDDTEIKPVQPEPKHPDAKKHLHVSVVKSLVRIFAAGMLCQGDLFWAGSLLILAEGLGIIEELV